MKKIKLTQGKHAIVDDEDFDFLNQWKWYCDKGYAVRWAGRIDGRRIRLPMHRVINNTPAGMQTDHANRNTLDNRKSNLRSCTPSQNQRNRLRQKNNKSGHKGIIWEVSSWHRTGRWRVYLYKQKKQICVGYFKDFEKAKEAYRQASARLYKEFGRL